MTAGDWFRELATGMSMSLVVVAAIYWADALSALR